MAPRYGASSTAREVVHGRDLSGKLALLTGGNAGLGLETVKALAAAGCEVIFTSRNKSAGDSVAQSISQGKVSNVQLDLASLASIDACAKAVLQQKRSIDYLICNAGVAYCPQQTTADGFEMQMGTNHFGHFRLVQGLLDRMLSQGPPARVVVLSSLAHQLGSMRLDDLHRRGRRYSGLGQYADSKLANALFAKELARRCKGTNVTAYSLHPGTIVTQITRHTLLGSRLVEPLLRLVTWPFFKSPEQGAATTVYAAVAEGLEEHSGAYLQNCQISRPAKAVEDEQLAAELWRVTEQQIQEAMPGHVPA